MIEVEDVMDWRRLRPGAIDALPIGPGGWDCMLAIEFGGLACMPDSQKGIKMRHILQQESPFGRATLLEALARYKCWGQGRDH
jgi:hypothetical protein